MTPSRFRRWASRLRSPGSRDELGTRVTELQRRVDRLSGELLASPYTAEPLLMTDGDGRRVIGYSAAARTDSTVYRGFEDLFRGPEQRVAALQRTYLPLFASRQGVVDIGCGRGEFLDLLRDAGVGARGVDPDAGMVGRSREKGHEVAHGDGNSFLASQPDGSLGAIFSAQVIEHLSYTELTRFFELSRQKLEPGGLLVAETMNPHSLAAFKLFWVDPTHVAPIFPEVAVALCRLHGFSSARVVFPDGVDELERDRVEQFVYAVVATR